MLRHKHGAEGPPTNVLTPTAAKTACLVRQGGKLTEGVRAFGLQGQYRVVHQQSTLVFSRSFNDPMMYVHQLRCGGI